MMREQVHCASVLEDLSLVVDGHQQTVEKYADHIADCDQCRDAIHDARQTARVIVDAGADYQPPDDMEARVLAAIDADDTMGRSETPAHPPVSTPKPEVAPAEADQPLVEKKPQKSRRGLWIMAAAAGFLVLVGATGLWLSGIGNGAKGRTGEVAETGDATGTEATLVQVARAAQDGASGVSIRPAGSDAFVPVTTASKLTPGTTVQTDARTRARLELSDGSTLILNHDTELTLDRQTPRLLQLPRGEVMAEVAHLDNSPNAMFQTPTGRVEVVGTKLIVTANDDVSSVRVTRGQVRIHSESGGQADVKAGEEGLLSRQTGLSVAPAINLAGSVGWTEFDTASGEGLEASTSGLGELRAHRPGEREDTERPITLAHHRVKVRIVGNVARTEIEEVFRNDSGQVLEGVYRFPLPPDARIARLALDVDGQMEEGAFVERDVASKIWQGVIRRATPRSNRQRQQEFIWVPGPWRDPALLEWQQGGRFELRIFPIPAHGERRVQLAYEQTIAPQGKNRRYVYPLAHSADASTKVGQFDVDIRVAGNDPAVPVAPHGYGMQVTKEGNATSLRMSQSNFLPAGDIVVDYALPDSDAEIRWWTFAGEAAAAPSMEARRTKRGRGSSEAVVNAQKALAADNRPYVVFALRPELPVRAQAERQSYVFVVDSSQSMVGERYSRATELVTGLISEMDRRDRFALLACDVSCQTLPGGQHVPSAQSAAEARQWLGTIRPAGASNLVATLEDAAQAARTHGIPGHRARVVYIGDGMASVGHRSAAALAATAAQSSQNGQVRLTTVGIGGDADAAALSAIARAGGGHYVPFIPGQRTGAAALAVLETTYGISLENPVVEMPAGVVDTAPATLPTIRAGEEILVVGRFSGNVQGQLVLRGTVGGEPYMDRYPVSLTASTAAGNAFVPRVWAASQIEQMELSGHADARDRTVAMSRGYGVMSRHTSLLVLESEAMFQAFRLDRARPAVSWSGEDDMEMGESTGMETQGAMGRLASKSAPGASRAQRRVALDGVFSNGADAEAAAGPAPAPDPAPRVSPRDNRDIARRGRRPGSWMRRVWERVGSVQSASAPRERDLQAVTEAEAALRLAPDSRDRHRDLVRALSRAGSLDRALEVAEQWVGRDQLDPEALIHLADVTARIGKRDEAVRLLSGIVDLSSDDMEAHQRLADAFTRFGQGQRACDHMVSIAEIDGNNAERVGAAVRCERSLGRQSLAQILLDGLEDSSVRQRAERAASVPPTIRPIRGDVMLDATWTGPQDLDLSLIDARGNRLSWMGGRRNVVAEAASGPGRERLGVRWTPSGTYFIEISRTDAGQDAAPVSGQIRVRALGQTRTLPFVLSGARAQVGSVRVRRVSRMVPM